MIDKIFLPDCIGVFSQEGFTHIIRHFPSNAACYCTDYGFADLHGHYLCCNNVLLQRKHIEEYIVPAVLSSSFWKLTRFVWFLQCMSLVLVTVHG